MDKIFGIRILYNEDAMGIIGFLFWFNHGCLCLHFYKLIIEMGSIQKKDNGFLVWKMGEKLQKVCSKISPHLKVKR